MPNTSSFPAADAPAPAETLADMAGAALPRAFQHAPSPADTPLPLPDSNLPVFAQHHRAAQPVSPVARGANGVLALAGVAWTGCFVWASSPPASALQGLALVQQWAGPMLLLAALWLIVARSSTLATARYTAAAAQLRAQAAMLAAGLDTTNRQIADAQERLRIQSAELDRLGQAASERLTRTADQLSTHMADNSQRLEAIGAVSEVALANMEQLGANLPHMTTSAKDLASNIGNSGRLAAVHAQHMSAALAKLNEFAPGAERLVASLRERIDMALDTLEARSRQLEASINGRMEALEARSTGFALDLERNESEARDAMRQRAAQLADEVGAAKARLESEEAESLTSLRARMGALREEAATLGRALRDSESGALADWQDATMRLAADIARLEGELAASQQQRLEGASRLGALTEATTARLVELDARMEALATADHTLTTGMEERLEMLEKRLSDTDTTLMRLTDASVRLLELVQASAQHSREALPAALEASAGQLAAYHEGIEALAGRVAATGEQSVAMAATLREAGAHIDGSAQTLAALRETLGAIDHEAQSLATRTSGELEKAVQLLARSAQAALLQLDEDGPARVAQLAQTLGRESSTAINAAFDKALRLSVGEMGGRLEQAAAHAAGLSREAAAQMRAELAQVSDLIGHLEAQIAAAHTKAEAQVDNDFARRAAIITDALQSKAIDIAKALDSDVADTAWAAYLRGDRGIFSRRAVKLLEAGEARAVLGLYEGDPALRAAINHYIHDFEGMLRQLLSTRDGQALSVTLLSSDLGKLYVALAQAIDRLRG